MVEIFFAILGEIILSAETSQLVFFIISTLYLNKEFFLQEFISNTSNALIKIHDDDMTDTFKLSSRGDLEIDNIPSPQQHMLILVDTGIGTTKADLINNLGSIAKPGTKMFMENLQDSADLPMIWVAFFSTW
ncbi:hypothetical protein STEG23_005117 [Scotinomys teguina]